VSLRTAYGAFRPVDPRWLSFHLALGQESDGVHGVLRLGGPHPLDLTVVTHRWMPAFYDVSGKRVDPLDTDRPAAYPPTGSGPRLPAAPAPASATSRRGAGWRSRSCARRCGCSPRGVATRPWASCSPRRPDGGRRRGTGPRPEGAARPAAGRADSAAHVAHPHRRARDDRRAGPEPGPARPQRVLNADHSPRHRGRVRPRWGLASLADLFEGSPAAFISYYYKPAVSRP
jgi:hypothetical protein